MNEKIIKSIQFDNGEYLNSQEQIENHDDSSIPQGSYRIKHTPIIEFEKSGELWFKQRDEEYNGRYVRSIIYL